MIAGQPNHLGNVQSHMARRVRREISRRQGKQSYCRTHPPPIGRMPRASSLLLQMDERSGELNKALEKGVVFILALQPQVFEDVMGLVILLRVEADEIRQVAGIE